ncbi:hypothetical protein SODALDRAFT_350008 [Sodiomyces alkalinus F11]|uniref:Uncharacterized protein n=1 Tax=Sodiomyces alkalinus (strain CBS 110278 / VKM F-3762 / F11) TaxID=1314773 RepID=A0A3N2PZG0_SODAK|nr:hypothetical protein SODALDRAFT_350008 [Sodiomyces alkalinus F11]ROT39909.1 hypothetical protein SODALDRAFT_350008 [Sodiomyces alkalinus F11]
MLSLSLLIQLSLLAPLVPLAAAITRTADAPTPAPTADATAADLTPHVRNPPLDPTAPWVSVNKKGTPTTVTPVPTTVSGTPTILSGAPNVLTGTVFAYADFREGKVVTSTGDPPLATARNKNGRGAYPPCSNHDGQFAPFCLPAAGSEIHPGKTYYVTWDWTLPILKSNVTEKFKIKILGHSLNTTTEEVIHEVLNPELKYLSPVKHGFFPWQVSGKIIPKGQDNITVRLTMQRFLDDEVFEDDDIGADITGPTILVRREKKLPPKTSSGKFPDGKELYIALPSVFGFIILSVFGGLVWNRRLRRIGLGNVMSTSRHGQGDRTSRAKKLLRRMTKGKPKREAAIREEAVRLMAMDRNSMALEDSDSDSDSDDEWVDPQYSRATSTKVESRWLERKQS